MDGLRVEQNTWRVVSVKDGEATLRQRIRQPDGSRPKKPDVTEKATKLLGLKPTNGKGKLAANKGVLVIPDNYGLAILDYATDDSERFQIIPWHKVWIRINKGLEGRPPLKMQNGGKPPESCAMECLVRLKNTKPNRKRDGIWRIYTAQASMKLDLVSVDAVERQKKGDDVWREVSLTSLGPETSRFYRQVERNPEELIFVSRDD